MTDSPRVASYLAELEAALKRGDAREHTHRPAIHRLLEASGERITATNEPAREGGNAPDFVISRGMVPIGHVETKDVGETLNKVLKTEQLKRYREALPNLLLTDYLEFIWLVDGAERARIVLAEWDGKKIIPRANAAEEWTQLIGAFLNHQAETLRTPTQLAQKLAAQTRLLKEAVLRILQAEQGQGELSSEKSAFEATLLPNLTDDEFADMFAQTIAYGMFTARRFDTTPKDFSRQEAANLIPKTNPFLRRFFQYIAGNDLHPGLAWLVDNMAELMLRVDMTAILEHYGRKRGFEDPVFHFYERFLAAYDPHLRESRGVYYTPEPVVDFIVRGVDELLRERFGRAQGLADGNTLILDPAVGTATFLRNVLQQVRSRVVENGQAGMWSSYVSEKLLPRLFGFELMMAPYTVAHLKLALELADTGYEFREGERVNVFLTNTLEEIQNKTGTLMARWLSEEAEAAEQVKKVAPVQVVLGNPPYSGISENKGAWIESLIAEYKKEPDGSPLKERKHWLNDDYVKFIRFAHWRVMQTGHGIVAFITNHGWLDNPTFRGMRASLLRDFDEIYVLDLHGNSKKKERAPDGGEDKNVFDIQQGVAILFLVRKESPSPQPSPVKGEGANLPSPLAGEGQGERGRHCVKVFHAELYGSREGKYDWLEQTSFAAAGWQEIAPRLPLLVFKPETAGPREEYEQGWKVTDIFPVNSTGILTARDHFALDFEREALEARIRDFSDPANSDETVRTRYFGKSASQKYLPGDTRGWKITDARKTLRGIDWEDFVKPCLYRPFDKRYVLYHKTAVDWGRWDVMQHMLQGENLALVTSRMTKGESYQHALVSDSISEVILLSPKTSNNAFVFPLWLYPASKQGDWVNDASAKKSANFAPKFLAEVERKLGASVQVTPETLFAYIYAVLHSPTYRSRYTEYLKSDFPRVPLTASHARFEQLAALGAKLIALHLLRAPELDRPVTSYPVDGAHLVEKVSFVEREGRVCINPKQYFAGIEQADWDFHIGGYRVLEKWLKDRKGRTLSTDDIVHYQRIVSSVRATRGLMGQIDEAIGEWPLL
ncbi:MAG: type ISP restriction/modification enzyme [Gallionella sp.]|nr:type ISP restriction/modification enzyme [Gallionella sp.]